MDCARFEADLAALLDEGREAVSGERLAALSRHAERCTSCIAALPLVEWAALPAGETDPDLDPGEVYWEALGRRVQERISRDPPLRVRSWRLAAAVVAATFLAALAFLAGWRETSLGAPVSSVADESEALFPEAEADFGMTEMEADLEAVGDLLAGDEWLDGMDETEKRRLLEWLRAERVRSSGGAV